MPNESTNGPATRFGGSWTVKKLKILRGYLDAYTTALKHKGFELLYIDAFAGSGYIELLDSSDREFSDKFIEGSANIALQIQDRPFDKLLLVEKDQKRCEELKSFRDQNMGRGILVSCSDANAYLQRLELLQNSQRGVLFLDPFGAAVEWATISRIANLQALDTWILFPIGAIQRLLPTSRIPDDVDPKWAKRLTKVYGDESWRRLYHQNPQGSLFVQDDLPKQGYIRDAGIDGLLDIYKSRLSDCFGSRLLEESCTLSNSTRSPLFEFIFCAGNKKGEPIAKRIAKHLMKIGNDTL